MEAKNYIGDFYGIYSEILRHIEKGLSQAMPGASLFISEEEYLSTHPESRSKRSMPKDGLYLTMKKPSAEDEVMIIAELKTDLDYNVDDTIKALNSTGYLPKLKKLPDETPALVFRYKGINLQGVGCPLCAMDPNSSPEDRKAFTYDQIVEVYVPVKLTN